MIAALLIALVASQTPNSPPEQRPADSVTSIEAVPLSAPLVSLISPTGKQLALGTQDGGVWILDVPTKRFVSKLQAPHELRVDMSWSQDGSSLAVLGGKGEVIIAEAATGATRSTFTPPHEDQPSWTPNHAIELAANGEVLVALHGGTAEVVSVSDGAHRYTWKTTHQQRVSELAVSLDGARVAMGTVTGEVTVWNARSGARVDSLTVVPSDPNRERVIHDIAFAPDGERVMIGAEDCSAWLWSPGTSRPPTILSLCDFDAFGDDGIGCVRFSPDGTRVLATTYGQWMVRVWNVASGMILDTFDNGGGNPGSMPAWFTSDSEDIVVSLGCLVSPKSVPWISYESRVTQEMRTWWQSNGEIAWAEVDGNLVVRNVRNPEPILRIPVAPYPSPAPGAGGK